LKRSTILVIAESSSNPVAATFAQTSIAESVAATDAPLRRAARQPQREPLSISRVVSAMHLVLATRRNQHSDEHGYWYTLARGI
jgi:hypothetical protein